MSFGQLNRHLGRVNRMIVVKQAQTNLAESEQAGIERFIFDINFRAICLRVGLRMGSLVPVTNRVNRQAR